MNATLSTPHARPCPIAIREADGWLLLESDVPISTALSLGARVPAPEALLAWNAALAGGAKFVLTPDLRAHIHAELPWGGLRSISAVQAAATAGIEQAQRLWLTPAASAEPVQLPVPAALSMALDRGPGWRVSPLDANTLTAEIAVAGSRWQASLLATPDGALAFVHLLPLPHTSAIAQRALAVLLLLAGNSLRWARPTVRSVADQPVALFEVLLGPEPETEDFADALSILCLACRMCGAEAKLLLSEPVARDYSRSSPLHSSLNL